jgi:hypothetical protein
MKILRSRSGGEREQSDHDQGDDVFHIVTTTAR